MNGLDLFSGIGGLTVALVPWVKPVAYCENDRYAQAVLLSRMASGDIPIGPIWDDVRTLNGADLDCIDIIYGGFPCQDISCAGNGAGLAGERSGLFFQIMRLVDEIRPSFIFLENVPAIATRGFDRVLSEITARGYDSRWCVLAAAEVGAPHLRKRWWLLAHAMRERREESSKPNGQESKVGGSCGNDTDGLRNALADAASSGCGQGDSHTGGSGEGAGSPEERRGFAEPCGWAAEPDVSRVAHGIPARVDRLRGIGNAVVPLQARTAFARLSGLEAERGSFGE